MNEARRQQAEAEVAFAAEQHLKALLKEDKGLDPEKRHTPEMIYWSLKGATRSALYRAAFSETEIESFDRDPIIRAAMEMQGVQAVNPPCCVCNKPDASGQCLNCKRWFCGQHFLEHQYDSRDAAWDAVWKLTELVNPPVEHLDR